MITLDSLDEVEKMGLSKYIEMSSGLVREIQMPRLRKD